MANFVLKIDKDFIKDILKTSDPSLIISGGIVIYNVSIFILFIKEFNIKYIKYEENNSEPFLYMIADDKIYQYSVVILNIIPNFNINDYIIYSS